MNKVELIGRLTKDVELRKTQSGTSTASFNLAVKRRGKEESDFISCTAWRQSAEFLSTYAPKGSLISVIGRIEVSSYKRDGETFYQTKVQCEEVELLARPKEKKEELKEPTLAGTETFENADFKNFGHTDPLLEEDEELPFY